MASSVLHLTAALAPFLAFVGVQYARRSSKAKKPAEASAFPKIRQSQRAARTVNPIRGVVEKIDKRGNPEKAMIDVSLGDPTKYGDAFVPPPNASVLLANFESRKHNGYLNSSGSPAVREVIASKFSFPNAPLTADDIVLASGASGAIEIALGALCDPGSNILVPCPGFPLYESIATSLGADVKRYPLDALRNWEADLEALEALIDGNTACIVVTNPSNPCGSVYSDAHLVAILAIAQRHGLPILADEIYEDMVFTGVHYTPLATLTQTVPVLSVGGTAKRYMVPGWRLGWLRLYDRGNALAEVRVGCFQLAQLILGPCSLIQSVVPSLLQDTDEAYHRRNNAALEAGAMYCYDRLTKIPGLVCTRPGGTLYLMCLLDMAKFDLGSDMVFVQKLLDEESVFVLPGQCFAYPNAFRIVTCPPRAALTEACDRIEAFCARHAKK
eukprot:c39994_g1_i1.p1 GENE.c39994_g1_i1~~c39994_g1_i1.p1  ORF type:complete len:453 (+),score=89.67 c39994_g1_i1:36-1361(+)